MSYRISKFFSAVVQIGDTFLPLRTGPTMRGRSTVKTYHVGPTQLEQPKPTVHGHFGPTHPTAGQADHRAAKTTANQTKCWQRHYNLTRGHAATGLTKTKHAPRETNDVGERLQQPDAARRANRGHRKTRDQPTTGKHDNSEPTQRAGHAPVATQPQHRTDPPPQTSKLTEKTTKTTPGYSPIDPTTHKPTIRRVT